MDGLLTPPGVVVDGPGPSAARTPPTPPPSAILPITWPVSLSNDVMAAEAGAPLMAALIAAAPAAARATAAWPRYARVMFSTGPMLVTSVATGRGGAAAAAVLANVSSSAAPLYGVLPPGLYGKYGPRGVRLGEHHGGGSGGGGEAGGGEGGRLDAPAPLFSHLHGSSWHGSDAAAAIWAAHHGWALGGWGTALGLAVLSAGAAVHVRGAAAARRAAAAAAAMPGHRRASHRRRPSSANLDAYTIGAVATAGSGPDGAPPVHAALDAAAKMC